MNPISQKRLDTLFLAVNVAQTSKGVNHELRYYELPVFCLCGGERDLYLAQTGAIKTIKLSKITRITGGYRLEIDEHDGPLVITDEMFHRYRFKAGIVLTEPQLTQLVVEAELARCDQAAGRLLAMRDHTVGELEGKLRVRKYTVEAIEAAVKKYRAAGVLDDARVANDLARRMQARKPAGRSYLVALLQRKRIARSLAERVADHLLQGVDETASAVQALAQRWPQPDQIDIESVRTKAYSYLSRRGFGYQTARSAVTQHFEIDGKVEED